MRQPINMNIKVYRKCKRCQTTCSGRVCRACYLDRGSGRNPKHKDEASLQSKPLEMQYPAHTALLAAKIWKDLNKKTRKVKLS